MRRSASEKMEMIRLEVRWLSAPSSTHGGVQAQSPGCVVVTFDDRWLPDRITPHTLAFEGDSRIEWFEGRYQDHEKDREQRLGADPDQPHRINHRRTDARAVRRPDVGLRSIGTMARLPREACPAARYGGASRASHAGPERRGRGGIRWA